MTRLLPVWFAVALTLMLGSADAWAKGNAASGPIPNPPAEIAPVSSSAPAAASRSAAETPSLDQSYRSREARAQALETFEGGDVVVIGGSTLLIVLLIVLIVVLI